MEAALGLIFLMLLIVGLIAGGIQTFQRNWIIALFMFVFFGPLWICWALIENFLPKPVNKPIDITVTHIYK